MSTQVAGNMPKRGPPPHGEGLFLGNDNIGGI